ncbi:MULTISPECIES: hypothetical protein [unclassified Mesorhizobium]|uniref:hypothetical protein n=1 Tax=unclassified Mesorhizobium TaxID=325217 RepID=UPI001FDFD2CC|nr:MULTISPECIES: hypothetical protein [unclassified Mesorhizobium]
MLIDKLHAFTSPRLAVIDVNATVQAAALSLSRPGGRAAALGFAVQGAKVLVTGRRPTILDGA